MGESGPLREELRRRYAATILELGTEPLDVDLRRELSAPDVERIRQLLGSASLR